MIVMSPRSTVTRLVAPRNVVAMTVPTSGPDSLGVSETIVTASGLTSAVTGPGRVELSTSGRSHAADGDRRPLTVAGEPVGEADELGDEGRRRPRVHLGGRRELLDLAAPHHADPVGDGQRLLLVVGHEQRR